MLDLQRSLSQRRDSAFTWFSRLWAVAVLAHILGNPRLGQVWPDPTPLGFSSLLLGLAAIGLLLLPSRKVLLAVVAVLTLVTVWFEAPVIGNHWLLAGFVSLALLVSLLMTHPWEWFARTGRWLLLGFYAFAAFAKLNTDFFDPAVSCALAYTNDGLSAVGLPTVDPSASWAIALPVATAVIELAVPILLLIPRSRRWGVVLGVAFHTLVSFDLGQHFYDFTPVLYPLFFLFLPDHTLAELESRTRLAQSVQPFLAGLLAVFVVATVIPLTGTTHLLLTRGTFVLWIPFALWLLWKLVRNLPAIADVPLEVPGPVAALLVALVFFNGLTPYLEIKTGTGWNMYANLLTADGESNHLLVRQTIPLTDGNRDPVVVLETDDPGLAAYVGSGYALPESRFRHYLAEHPEARVVYEQAGERHDGTGAELGERLPVVAEKFQLFRAIDLERPVRCQLYWLPAG